MKILQVLSFTSAMILFVFNMPGIAKSEEGSRSTKGIRPEIVADFIYAVIESDRTLYTTHVVDRMQETGTVIVSESWSPGTLFPSRLICYCCLETESSKRESAWNIA